MQITYGLKVGDMSVSEKIVLKGSHTCSTSLSPALTCNTLQSEHKLVLALSTSAWTCLHMVQICMKDLCFLNHHVHLSSHNSCRSVIVGKSKIKQCILSKYIQGSNVMGMKIVTLTLTKQLLLLDYKACVHQTQAAAEQVQT